MLYSITWLMFYLKEKVRFTFYVPIVVLTRLGYAYLVFYLMSLLVKKSVRFIFLNIYIYLMFYMK